MSIALGLARYLFLAFLALFLLYLVWLIRRDLD
jgi:uncharacterized membrane protein YtjA (UPF0391 family)